MDEKAKLSGSWVDARAMGQYIGEGREHFTHVRRSWSVFRLNASELRSLLISVETNPVAAAMLMKPAAGGQGDERMAEFWRRLDQRLHNMVSSAITLVEVTRLLVRYYAEYPHNADFVAACTERSERVRDLPVSGFLSRFRNYLLHCGSAPLARTLRLGSPRGANGEWDNFEIQLSAEGLLRWSGWYRKNREYIASFQPGPPLRKLTEEYFSEMADFHQWLDEQESVLHVPGVPPPHVIHEGPPPA